MNRVPVHLRERTPEERARERRQLDEMRKVERMFVAAGWKVRPEVKK